MGSKADPCEWKIPIFSEGIVEKRRIVAAKPRRHRIAKVHAVRADGHLRHVALRRSEIVEHLIAFLRMLGLLIEPHAGTVPLPAGLGHKNAVGAHLIIQHLPREMPPVGGNRQRRSVKPAGVVIQPIHASAGSYQQPSVNGAATGATPLFHSIGVSGASTGVSSSTA